MHSPYNRTQTPLRTSMSPTSPVRRRPHSNSSSGSQYLQNALGDVLADALSQVAKKRPADPIQYVADYLHSVSSTDSQRLGSKGMIINLFFTLYKNYDNDNTEYEN